MPQAHPIPLLELGMSATLVQVISRSPRVCQLSLTTEPPPIPRTADLGASFTLSMCALLDLEAAGIPVAQEWYDGCNAGGVTVACTSDLTHIPVPSESVEFVICRGVLHRLPRDLRPACIAEMWRLLRPGGTLIVLGTPSRVGSLRGGVSYRDLTRALPRGSWRYGPESGRMRHRALTALGLPASLLDPYPIWRLAKERHAAARPAEVRATAEVSSGRRRQGVA